jgi:hypothetical protein
VKLAALISVGVAVGIAGIAHAAMTVKEGPESCSNAHAVVVASKSGKHDFIWGEIKRTIAAGNGKWQLVDEYEPGVSQRVSLRQYDLKYVEGGSAYVVHCGHGGTCNSFVQAFFKSHPDWYSPEVFCGIIPEALQNPQKP